MNNKWKLVFCKASFLSVLILSAMLPSNAVFAVELDGKKKNLSSGSELRVCAAKKEMPYSNVDGEGFENKIATELGKAMDIKVSFFWSKKPSIYYVRDFLDKKKCDLIIGLDQGDTRILASPPYYRSSYAFVFKKDRGLKIKDWNSPDLKKLKKFAVAFGSPGELMLKEIGKWDDSFNYMHSLVNFKSRRNQFVRAHPGRMVSEVASGKADIAVVWMPEAARYIKQHEKKLTYVLLPEIAQHADNKELSFHYTQVMGVRKGDEKLIKKINKALSKIQGKIETILKQEGIPILPIKQEKLRAG